MKIIFFFGTKISKKKLGENILWHTHITSLSFRSSILVIYRDLSWITVNVVIVLSCEYLWFPVVSKGSNVPGQIEKHKKPQETTRNSLFFCEDCEDFRCRSKAHFCNTVNYCDFLWKLFLCFLVDSEVILVISCGRFIHSVDR